MPPHTVLNPSSGARFRQKLAKHWNATLSGVHKQVGVTSGHPARSVGVQQPLGILPFGILPLQSEFTLQAPQSVGFNVQLYVPPQPSAVPVKLVPLTKHQVWMHISSKAVALHGEVVVVSGGVVVI